MQKKNWVSKPLPRRQEQKLPHVQTETWYQHRCSGKDLQLYQTITATASQKE